MDRLTEYVDGKYIRIKGTRSLYPAQERKGAPASNAIVRLAAYEDTGRAPDEMRWISVKDKLPSDLEPVNIVWVNREPELYYASIKDKPFVGTGYYYNSKWWWYSWMCEDYLMEYGYSEPDSVDKCIEVTHWMPLPAPPKETDHE